MSNTVVPDLNYCNDRYPVLSFAYALYCEAGFREPERNEWRKSAGAAAAYTPAILAGAYDGFLDYFSRDLDRGFPPAIRDLIRLQVPMNPPDFVDERGAFNPSPAQASQAAASILDELMGRAPGPNAAANAGSRPARNKARINAQRPVLSCLAVIFLNQDPAFTNAPQDFLAGQELTPLERQALLQFGSSGRTTLAESEAQALRPAIEDELQRFPSCW
jgi:hypothetical protein